jgi:hypothetical protein
MRNLVLASFAAMLIAGGAQAQGLRLHNPADTDRDGVVTDAERAAYAAKKGDAAPWDQPSAFSVNAPPSAGGPSITLGENPNAVPSPARLEDRAVQASGLEEYINAEADRKRRD